jgi:hypothetical protein
MRSMVEGASEASVGRCNERLGGCAAAPPPRFARSPSPANAGEDLQSSFAVGGAAQSNISTPTQP